MVRDVRRGVKAAYPWLDERRFELDDERILSWIRHAHEHSQWTTSVCTGSLLLGAAGVLDGLPATSHWLELETLSEYGAVPTGRRVVEHGKVITAAGVSAGIDMGLPREQAYRLACSTFAGASELARASQDPPEVLR